jgi:hypothetical protein
VLMLNSIYKGGGWSGKLGKYSIIIFDELLAIIILDLEI